MSKTSSLLLLLPDPDQAQTLSAVLDPAGYAVQAFSDLAAARQSIEDQPPELALLSYALEGAPDFAAQLSQRDPACGLVLVLETATPKSMSAALNLGACAVLQSDFENTALLEALGSAARHNKVMRHWLKRETGRITGNLNRRLNELESILKQVSDGVVVLDEDQRIVIINRAMRQTFQLGQGDLSGQPLRDLITDEQWLEVLGAREERLLRGEIEAPDGKSYSVKISQVPDVGAIASLHDISDLKELDRLKGDFVNAVSHDLRSPLTAILGYVELIERAGEVNEQQASFIQRVKDSVASTTKLINDLLNLGRIEVGSEAELEQLDLREIVGERVEHLRASAEEKAIKLRTQYEKRLPLIVGNPTHLRQVADNLIGNAIKYTPERGEVRIMLREQGDQVVFHVGDNGPGIPAAEHGRIFEKFYRAEAAPADVEGTGLGLAIVKGIVDNHRGRIWVDSRPGQGSVFSVVLPIAPSQP